MAQQKPGGGWAFPRRHSATCWALPGGTRPAGLGSRVCPGPAGFASSPRCPTFQDGAERGQPRPWTNSSGLSPGLRNASRGSGAGKKETHLQPVCSWIKSSFIARVLWPGDSAEKGVRTPLADVRSGMPPLALLHSLHSGLMGPGRPKWLWLGQPAGCRLGPALWGCDPGVPGAWHRVALSWSSLQHP